LFLPDPYRFRVYHRSVIEHLIELDQRLFLWVNEKHNSFWDPIMYWASDQWIWIPLYVFLGYWLYRRYHRFAIYLILCITLLITLSDQSSSHLKDWVRRPRPSHTSQLAGQVHLSIAGPGGEYGFISSHAANCFALCVFLGLVLPHRDQPIKWLLLVWALFVCYSRVYNGVHYPGDVIGGIVLGCLLGWAMSRLFRLFVSAFVVNKRR
jgi:undecaprenyl-diphosphatase